MHTLFDTQLPTHGDGACFYASITPHLKVAGPHRAQFLGFPSIYRTPLVAEIPNLRCGEGTCFRGQSRAHPRGGAQRSPILWIPVYLCVHPLSQDYQILRGNTCGEGRVSWGQPRLPSHNTRVPGLPNFAGSSVFMSTAFNAERPNSAW